MILIPVLESRRGHLFGRLYDTPELSMTGLRMNCYLTAGTDLLGPLLPAVYAPPMGIQRNSVGRLALHWSIRPCRRAGFGERESVYDGRAARKRRLHRGSDSAPAGRDDEQHRCPRSPMRSWWQARGCERRQGPGAAFSQDFAQMPSSSTHTGANQMP